MPETNRSKYKQCQRIRSRNPSSSHSRFPPESNANKRKSKEAKSLCVFQRLLAKSQLNLCQHHGFYLFVVLFFVFALPLILSLSLLRSLSIFCAVFKCKLIKTIEGKQNTWGSEKVIFKLRRGPPHWGRYQTDVLSTPLPEWHTRHK